MGPRPRSDRISLHGLTSFQAGLTEAISDSVGRSSGALRRTAPRFLYHYTAADKVAGIVQSRSIWARCINDQTDPGEISHAAGLVTQAAEQTAQSEPSIFAKDVLRRLPFFMEERKKMDVHRLLLRGFRVCGALGAVRQLLPRVSRSLDRNEGSRHLGSSR